MGLFSDRLTDIASCEGYWINQNLVYDSNGNIIGKMLIHYYSEKFVFISLIAIYPEYRGNGHFRALVDLVSRVADLNGDTVQLMPLASETDDIPCSNIPLAKLQEIYMAYGFTPDTEGVEVTTYTREPVELK